MIRHWIIEQLKQCSGPYIILESPLLFETDQHQLVDSVLLVDLPEALQIERASARDSNQAEQIARIIQSQMPRQEKLSRADFVFDNTQPVETLETRVAELHRQFTALAENRA